MLYSEYENMCNVSQLLLQSHGRVLFQILVKFKSDFVQHMLQC